MSAQPAALRADKPRGRVASALFKAFLLFSMAIGIVTLGALLVQVVVKGYKSRRPGSAPRAAVGGPAIAGARPAILATIYLGLLLIAFTVPIGVGTAIYLEEYANRDRWYNRLLEVNIQNLAGVPSIVYGILGLAFLVRGLGLGRVLLAGAMILTLLVLPTVIIAAREAIRAVPDSIRQGAYALGATKWQVVWRQVLPAATPGIATGSILALSRGLGETAPLLLVGALTYVAFDPTILGDFTALPVQIFQWIARPQEDFRILAASGIIVLLIDPPDAERFRDLGSQPLPEKVVTMSDTIPEVSMDRLVQTQREPLPARELARGRLRRGRPRRVLQRQARAQGRVARDLSELRDRIHRAVGLREEHLHPLLQPHERPDPGREDPRQDHSTTAPTSTGTRSTPSRCASGSGWCSRSRTRSRSRSTTTSPSGRGCSA